MQQDENMVGVVEGDNLRTEPPDQAEDTGCISTCAMATFYNETVLSKDAKGLPASKTSVLVGAFFLAGGFLMGMGTAVFLSTDEGYAPVAALPSLMTAHSEAGPDLYLQAEGAGTTSFTLPQASREPFAGEHTVSVDILSDHIIQLVEYVEHFVAAINVIGTHSLPSMPLGLPGGFGQLSSSGSGILFYEDEERVFIATNAHVIENATHVTVRVMDSAPLTARLVGQSIEEDIAVISIMKADFEDAGLLHYSLARFGDSDEIRVGQMVLAMGNALGGGNTATNGVISARQSQIVVEGREFTVLQTNAAINPGNSGGPLVNMNGEVVGINTAKVASAYNVEGMGYSITANAAIPTIEALMSRVAEGHAYLGIEGIDISTEVAQMYGLPEMGVFVNSVIEGSPAYLAGIRRGDIIASIDATPILTMNALQDIIRSHQPGERVLVRIIRDGTDQLELEATLERLVDTGF